jgi:hypothetical protein
VYQQTQQKQLGLGGKQSFVGYGQGKTAPQGTELLLSRLL